ncbi:hypothetical protein [Caulobacter mirabilis]|nr:hypothetical protein [Caulobacter mirabilis]
MRLQKVLATTAGLVVLISATAAQAQSLARRMDLLRLQDEVSAVAVQAFSDFESACPATLPRMQTLLADPRFDRIEVEVRRQFLFALMICAEVKEPPVALDAAARLEAIASEPSDLAAVYSMRISEALQRDDKAEAARRFLELAEQSPAVAATWEPELVSGFANGVPGDPDLSLKVLKTLVELPWDKPASKSAARNGWALAYGRLLADRGQTAEAARAVDKADELYVLLMIAGDRRFATLWPSWEAKKRFDWTALAEAQLARARTEMTDLPDQLRPAVDALEMLRALGRSEEAVLIGQAYTARLDDGERFDDAGAQEELLRVAVGGALLDLGKVAEAEASYRAAAASSPTRAFDAGLALAGLLTDERKGREATTVLNALDRDYLTPAGRAWLDGRRACAMASNDTKGAETIVADLRKTRDDVPGPLSLALLCLGHVEEAGDLLAWRLRSEQHRAGGLDPYWITRPPTYVAPGRAAFERSRQAMLDRPEARKALAETGRPVETPLSGDYWGGF